MIAVITVCIAVILLITVAIAFVFTTQVHVNLMIFWKAKDYETVFGIRSLFPLCICYTAAAARLASSGRDELHTGRR